MTSFSARTFSGFRITIISLIAVFFIAAGCSRTAAAAPDSAGIPPTIGKIISSSPSNTEITVGLGMGEFLIAIDKYSGNIPGLPAGLTEIDFFYPDIEAIIGLNPDIILVNEINSYGVADNPFKLLGDLGIKVVNVPASNSIDGICGDIMLVAEALGVKDRGEILVKSMKDEIAEIIAAVESADGHNRKSVYFEIASIPTLVTFGQGVYINEMIEIAGGRNIFTDQKGWFSASEEEIINRNPDIIFVLVYHGSDIITDVYSRGAFRNINAVKEGRVYSINEDSAARASHNIMKALREMARILND